MKKSPKTLKTTRHERRRKHVRKLVSGTSARPRVSVRRSLNNFYAQIIDDETGLTLAGLGTGSKDVRDDIPGGKGGNVTAAEVLGKKLAEKAKAVGVDTVVFDRNGYRFHGRVKAFADSLRSNGLNF